MQVQLPRIYYTQQQGEQIKVDKDDYTLNIKGATVQKYFLERSAIQSFAKSLLVVWSLLDFIALHNETIHRRASPVFSLRGHVAGGRDPKR